MILGLIIIIILVKPNILIELALITVEYSIILLHTAITVSVFYIVFFAIKEFYSVIAFLLETYAREYLKTIEEKDKLHKHNVERVIKFLKNVPEKLNRGLAWALDLRHILAAAAPTIIFMVYRVPVFEALWMEEFSASAKTPRDGRALVFWAKVSANAYVICLGLLVKKKYFQLDVYDGYTKTDRVLIVLWIIMSCAASGVGPHQFSFGNLWYFNWIHLLPKIIVPLLLIPVIISYSGVDIRLNPTDDKELVVLTITTYVIIVFIKSLTGSM